MQLGSNEERVIHEFCDQMQIPFDKIASEDFSAFMQILSLSKLLKKPNNMRGRLAHRHTMEQKAKDRYPIEWVAVFYEWQMRKSQ